MRASSLFAATAALMSPFAAADWYLYESTTILAADGTDSTQFQFFSGPPSCSDVLKGDMFDPSDDVSGKKQGIRCKGCSAWGDSINPTEVEINENTGHFSMLDLQTA